jgi:hypothetical protein
MQRDNDAEHKEIHDDGYQSDTDAEAVAEARAERRRRKKTIVQPTATDKIFITICLFCAEIAIVGLECMK